MIVFAHLYNDTSGSPRVLGMTIAEFQKRGEDVLLYVGSDGQYQWLHGGIHGDHY